MDLKYTEVSKQIGLAASHIEFDSQGDSILIDCYHLSCLWEMPQVKIIIFSYFTPSACTFTYRYSELLFLRLYQGCMDTKCSWDMNTCMWHWLRGIVILNPGHQTWNSFSSQLWQWIQNTLPATRVVWTLCEARRVAPPVQTTASCFPYSLIGFYDYPI